jgi:hypothetical protein
MAGLVLALCFVLWLSHISLADVVPAKPVANYTKDGWLERLTASRTVILVFRCSAIFGGMFVLASLIGALFSNRLLVKFGGAGELEERSLKHSAANLKKQLDAEKLKADEGVRVLADAVKTVTTLNEALATTKAERDEARDLLAAQAEPDDTKRTRRKYRKQS